MEMKVIQISLILCTKIFFTNSQDLSSKEYSHTQLDTTIGTTLFWHADFDTHRVNLEVEIPTNDSEKNDFLWFAIGFSDYGKISKADLCFMWFDEQMKLHFQHVWTDENSEVTIDPKYNDCSLSKRKKRRNTILFTSSRPFESSSENGNDYLIEEGTTHVVFATGQGLMNSIDKLKLDSFTHAFKRVILLKNSLEENEMLEMLKREKSVQFLNSKVNLPTVRTTNWYSSHSLPEVFTEKQHHIIGFEAVISPKENVAIINHMRLIHLNDPVKWNGPRDSLIKKNPFVLVNASSNCISNWARGANTFYFPLDVGYLVGGANASRHLLLEVHYENANGENDWIDSSGLKIYYTSKLREHNAGEFFIAQNDSHIIIPPGQSSFQFSGHCMSNCTLKYIPENGITIFRSLLHTHLLGRQIWIRHISKEGIELPELIRDNHYNTNFQEIRTLRKPVKVMPGDELIIECRYDSTSRDNITLGTNGENKNEMCASFLHYFPKMDLTKCTSKSNIQEINEYFEYMNKEERQPTDWKNKTWQDNYKSIKWSPERVNRLEDLYQTIKQVDMCNQIAIN